MQQHCCYSSMVFEARDFRGNQASQPQTEYNVLRQPSSFSPAPGVVTTSSASLTANMRQATVKREGSSEQGILLLRKPCPRSQSSSAASGASAGDLVQPEALLWLFHLISLVSVVVVVVIGVLVYREACGRINRCAMREAQLAAHSIPRLDKGRSPRQLRRDTQPQFLPSGYQHAGKHQVATEWPMHSQCTAL